MIVLIWRLLFVGVVFRCLLFVDGDLCCLLFSILPVRVIWYLLFVGGYLLDPGVLPPQGFKSRPTKPPGDRFHLKQIKIWAPPAQPNHNDLKNASGSQLGSYGENA